MERTLEQRVDELEKQVAELREPAQPKEVNVQPIRIHLEGDELIANLNRLTAEIKEISKLISQNS